jgi:hypothetical protein
MDPLDLFSDLVQKLQLKLQVAVISIFTDFGAGMIVPRYFWLILVI